MSSGVDKTDKNSIRESSSEQQKINRQLYEQKKEERERIKSQHAEEVQRLKGEQHAAINHLRNRNKKAEDTEYSRHHNKLKQMDQQTQREYQKAIEEKRIKDAQARQQEKIEKTNLADMKKQYQLEQKRQQEQHANHLNEMGIEHRRTINQKSKEYSEQHQSIEERKKSEFENMTAAYDQKIKDKAHRSKNEIRQLKDHHRNVIRHEEKDFYQTREIRQDHYEGELDKQKDFFEGNLAARDQHFNNRLASNDFMYQLKFKEQEEHYKDAMHKEHYKFLEQMQDFKDKQSDPFYRVKDLSAKMEDAGSHYNVYVPVPEHEIKNFKVHVQPEKITLSNVREFEEELKYKTQNVATNSHQTIRQEFLLPTPADHDLVQKEYNQGMMKISVPKKGF